MSLIIVLIGLICYDRLAVRLIPNVDEPIVTVFTSYPGANARVIESQITKPIEDALSGIEGVDFINSISRAESSQVSVSFKLARDPDSAASDVRDRVARARGALPEEANDPIVQKQEADARPIMYLAFSSDRHDLMEIADVAIRLVKDRIQTIPGVAEAQVYGNARRISRFRQVASKAWNVSSRSSPKRTCASRNNSGTSLSRRRTISSYASATSHVSNSAPTSLVSGPDSMAATPSLSVSSNRRSRIRSIFRVASRKCCPKFRARCPMACAWR